MSFGPFPYVHGIRECGDMKSLIGIRPQFFESGNNFILSGLVFGMMKVIFGRSLAIPGEPKIRHDDTISSSFVLNGMDCRVHWVVCV